MRCMTFSSRSLKEILRDPINLIMGLGFPLVLLLLLSAIGKRAPEGLFEIDMLAPGITVFGLSFMTLFSATLIAKDRESALLVRLYTTPMRGIDFILGYLLPILPVSLAQALLCYLLAIPLGLSAGGGIPLAILGLVPIAFFYISLGLLFGSVLSVKQVGGICGALLTNLSAWLSGIWFDPALIGEGFVRVSRVLPFLHAVEAERALLHGDGALALAHLIPVLLWGVPVVTAAVLLFIRQMKRQ